MSTGMESRSRDALAARLYADSAKAATAAGLTTSGHPSSSPLRPRKGGKPGAGNAHDKGTGSIGGEGSLSQSKSLPMLALAAQKRMTAAPSMPILPSADKVNVTRLDRRRDQKVQISTSYSASHLLLMIWRLQVMPSAASISTFSVLSEDDQGSQHMPNQTTELPTNQLSSPSHFMHHGEATGPALAQPASFVASVQLTPSQLQDFLYVDGHFVYLQPRGGLARTAYDLQAVDHTHVSEGVTGGTRGDIQDKKSLALLRAI